MASCDIEAGIHLTPLEPHSGGRLRVQTSGNTSIEPKKPRHDGLYARILGDRLINGEELTSEDEFYGSHDVEKVTAKGFPSIAAFHSNFANTKICRTFDYVTAMLMTRYQTQITCLLGALAELDAEEGTQSAPFDKEEFISRCLHPPDQRPSVQVPTEEEGIDRDEEKKKKRIDAARENIFENLGRVIRRYRMSLLYLALLPTSSADVSEEKLITWQSGLGKLPRVSADTHKRLFNHIRSMDGIESDSLDFFRAYDDFIYPDGDTLYERFYTFLAYVRKALVKSVRFLSCKTIFADGGASFGRGAYGEQTIRRFVKLAMAITSSTLILTPVGVLYLCQPGKVVSFLVVFVSELAFTFTLLAFDTQMSHVLVGIAAYSAVLVTFLQVIGN
ncbi:hypothetical protein NUW58_g1762 [Xylaria curta]|uniref:Uncharacterized protein n=1 Tax=Xylaria curta TaxID=42375 RepID=A0ACC1PIQ2_9PEZI|nr:hypothetical protein NUW58_g1762 [Xylaria curta]